MAYYMQVHLIEKWRKGSLRNSPISEETYQNQHVATDDDQPQSLK